MARGADDSRARHARRRAAWALAATGVIVAGLAALTAMLSGFGHRWQWWSYGAGFSILRWAAYGAVAGAGVSLVAGVVGWAARNWRAAAVAVVGLAVGLVTVGVPWSHLRTARSVPAIHDISTDTERPPEFVAVLPRRAAAPNPAEYGGAEVAARQRAAYPDLRPLTLAAPSERVFAHAKDVAEEMGWEIVAAVPGEGRLEATDTTFWYGFRDDVVVRLRPAGGGTRVDVRSVSRVGRSDIGVNARRIRDFLERLSAATASG